MKLPNCWYPSHPEIRFQTTPCVETTPVTEIQFLFVLFPGFPRVFQTVKFFSFFFCFCLGFFDPTSIFFENEINNFRGELSDISVKTATMVPKGIMWLLLCNTPYVADWEHCRYSQGNIRFVGTRKSSQSQLSSFHQNPNGKDFQCFCFQN